MIVEQTLASGMRFWIARPETLERRPTVLMLHERYGPMQHTFNMVERLAGDGYVACFPDMFHRFTGDRGPIEAGQARIDPTDAETLADLDEVFAHLRALDFVDVDHIGIAGFCLSGRTPLVFAAQRTGAAALAIFHGGVYPRDYAGELAGQQSVAELIPKLSCPVLGMFGELDHLVPLANVARFKSDLERSGLSYRIRVFARVPHAWLNSTSPKSYHAKEADEAWKTMMGFFSEVFDGKWNTPQPRRHFEPDAAIDFDFASTG